MCVCVAACMCWVCRVTNKDGFVRPILLLLLLLLLLFVSSDKPSRGHKIDTIAGGVPGSSDVGSPSPDQSMGNVSTRLRTSSPITNLHRRSGPVSGVSSVGHKWIALPLRSRPPLVLLKGEDQSPGSGHPGPHVARGSFLRLSTSAPDPTNAPQRVSLLAS